MNVLGELKPQSAFRFFEEITRIPRGSGNVEQISGYLESFAKERKLRVIRDEWNNVIIFKSATQGYEDQPVMILQGHMDMVAVKKPECDIDLKTEGLRVAIDGDNIYAEGTSLGGDDGIALAYALAILDSQTLKHPALEAVFTVDEEVGMDGARQIDLSVLSGKRLLNLDSEEEGIFLAGCAGGARVKCILKDLHRSVLDKQLPYGKQCRMRVTGLKGGHSGEEIDKGRGNSNILFGRILYRLCNRFPVRLAKVSGGLADNAIPRETEAELLVPEDTWAIEQILFKCEEEICAELGDRDPGFKLEFQVHGKVGGVAALSVEDTSRVAAFLAAFPNGVQCMSRQVPGLVETSLNLGILELNAGTKKLTAEFSVRSSVESAKEALIGKLAAITTLAGGKTEVTGIYPGWQYREDSPLREKMVRVYRELYGADPKVEAIHAGLECGLLGSKIKDLDCVSIGPDMKNIHTTEETLSISSTARVWEFLVKLLETKE